MILFGTTMYHLNTSTEDRIETVDGEETTIYANKEDRPMIQYIMNVYLLVFGEFTFDNFESEKNQTGRWFVFIIATILLQLIMLNLLIAIMSDTYEKVMAEIDISDGLELNNLILDAESLKFRNRDIVSKDVLHWVEYKTQSTNSWGGRSKHLKNALGSTEATMVKAITVQ